MEILLPTFLAVEIVAFIVAPELLFFFLPIGVFALILHIIVQESPQFECLKQAQQTNELTDFCKKVVEDYDKRKKASEKKSN